MKKPEIELPPAKIRQYNKENGYPEDYSPPNERNIGWNQVIEEAISKIKDGNNQK